MVISQISENKFRFLPTESESKTMIRNPGAELRANLEGGGAGKRNS